MVVRDHWKNSIIKLNRTNYIVKAWRKKYIDDYESPISIENYQDYLGNYEALLTTIEEDGVAKEDFFSFDFLDDA